MMSPLIYNNPSVHVPITKSPCSRKCPCVEIVTGKVSTLPSDAQATIEIEKEAGCSYLVSFGIPQGMKGDVGEIQGISFDGTCYILIAEDGNKVRCCLVKDKTNTYKWVCKGLENEQGE